MKEFVVRIIQPSGQGYPQAGKAPSFVQRAADDNPTVVGNHEGNGKNLFQILLNGAALAVIAGLGLFLAVSFFNVGFSFEDILIIVGIPLTVGLIASYATF